MLMQNNWNEILKKEPLFQKISECNESYPQSVIEELKQELNVSGVDRKKRIKSESNISKEAKNFKFSVIRGERGLFSLYPGRIATGDYGCVKLARDLDTQELCIVKKNMVCESENKEADIKRRFMRECEISERASLMHDKKYIDIKHNYMFLPLVEGVTLSRFQQLIKNHPLTLEEEVKLARSFMKVLNKLIDLDIRHNDLHSGNIMINPLDMKVTFIDYGKAKIGDGTFDMEESEEDEFDDLDESNPNDLEDVCKAMMSLVSKDSELYQIFRNLKRDHRIDHAVDSIESYSNTLTRQEARHRKDEGNRAQKRHANDVSPMSCPKKANYR